MATTLAFPGSDPPTLATHKQAEPKEGTQCAQICICAHMQHRLPLGQLKGSARVQRVPSQVGLASLACCALMHVIVLS